jgi:hypothetical protein
VTVGVVPHAGGSSRGRRVPKRLPNACPDCNGCGNLESMLCDDSLEHAPLLTVVEVREPVCPERDRIEDVDMFIDAVLGG